MTKITPLKNSIIFTFNDSVNIKGEFTKSATDSGILLNASFDESAKQPRWVTVTEVGPECKTVKPGMKVLLPALRWTAGFKINGTSKWKTDETQIVAYVENNDIVPTNKYVVFSPAIVVQETTSFGLVVLSNVANSTPSGKVKCMDNQCDSDLQDATVYYSDTNFTDMFEDSNKQKLAFIKEDAILAYVPVEA
jgi:co-chaperonin GroES (HSP10)